MMESRKRKEHARRVRRRVAPFLSSASDTPRASWNRRVLAKAEDSARRLRGASTRELSARKAVVRRPARSACPTCSNAKAAVTMESTANCWPYGPGWSVSTCTVAVLTSARLTESVDLRATTRTASLGGVPPFTARTSGRRSAALLSAYNNSGAGEDRTHLPPENLSGVQGAVSGAGFEGRKTPGPAPSGEEACPR